MSIVFARFLQSPNCFSDIPVCLFFKILWLFRHLHYSLGLYHKWIYVDRTLYSKEYWLKYSRNFFYNSFFYFIYIYIKNFILYEKKIFETKKPFYINSVIIKVVIQYVII